MKAQSHPALFKQRFVLTALTSVLVGVALSFGCSDSDSEAPPSEQAGAGGDNDGGGIGNGQGGSGGNVSEQGGSGGAVSEAGGAGVGPGEGGQAGQGGEGGQGEAPPLTANRPERRDFSPALMAQLRLKPGFEVNVFASEVMHARMLATGPDGGIYVTTPMTSEVRRLVDSNDDGDADDAGERILVASATDLPALQNVHGITFHAGKVYLASTKSIVAGTVADDGSFSGLQVLVSDLPDGGQHPYRTLAVGPDELLYVSIGSDCNACPESNSEHATMLRLKLDGTPADNPANPAHPMRAVNPETMISPRVWASGLRNTLGFDWHPTTGDLWGMDQGSDGLGEDTPPEEINRLEGGKSYGWPFCWGDQNPDPVVDDPSQTLSKEEYCATTEPSVDGLPAHSSPIEFLFYRADQFPAEYQNDAFLVLRGSWGRVKPDGYKVVRIHFEAGEPAPLPGSNLAYEDFLAGFLIENGRAHFGRIAGLTVDASGALLVSDDTNGMIYRVSYGDGGNGGAGGAGGAGGGTQ